jgi:hypothetical protein
VKTSTKRAARGAAALALVAAIGFGVVDAARPRATPEEMRRRALEERVARYVELRRSEDWKALYAMVDPEQRRKISERKFLAIHGGSVVRFHSVDARVVEVEPGAVRATAMLATDTELLVDELPEPYASKIRVDDPAQLRGRAEHPFRWVWRDGDWHWQLEKEIAAGRDVKGRSIAPLLAQGKGG